MTAKDGKGGPAVEGFLAGTASGLTKVAVGQPFDIIKVRMQCSLPGTYNGPLDCLKKTIAHEGPRALYKGSTPPMFGWVLSDMLLLGSLHNYQLWLSRWEARQRGEDPAVDVATERLSLRSHAIAGAGAGITCSLVMAPVDELKSKLQMQTTGKKSYTGPIDVAKQLIQQKGILAPWRNYPAAAAHRSFIGLLFLSYEVQMRAFHAVRAESRYKISESLATFISGGIASNVFWSSSYPLDVIKNRLMSDSISNPRYPTWRSAARAVWSEGGVRAVYRGFVPAMLRAFPTNGAALVVYQTMMTLLGAEKLKR